MFNMASMDVPSLEYVRQQHGEEVFVPLTHHIDQLYEILHIDTMKEDKLKKISAFLKNRFKLKFKVRDVKNQTIWVNMPIFNEDHVYNNPNMPKMPKRKKYIATQLLEKGFEIDLDTGAVKGAVSDISVSIEVDFKFILNQHKLNSKEIAACILHEVGHAIYSMILIHNITRTNTALETVARMKTPKKKKLEYVFKHLLTAEQKRQVEDSSSEEAGRLRTIDFVSAQAVEKLPARYGSLQHRRDEESFADAFAIRLGAGSALLTALEKLTIRKRYFLGGVIMFLLNKLMSSIKLLAIAIGSTGLATIASIAAPFYIVFSVVLTFFLPSSEFNSYGTFRMRCARILNQYIERLKTIELDPKDRQDLAYQAVELRAKIDTIPDEAGSLGVAILSRLNKRHIMARAIQLEESMLEELINNDLFVTHALITAKGETM